MRGQRGVHNPKAKLTDDDVRAIRASDEPQLELARRFGVIANTIYKIRTREIWQHVADTPRADIVSSEQWRPVTIEGYETLYEVSDQGNVRGRRQPHLPVRLRKHRLSKTGYVVFVLSRSNRQRKFLGHRLVALAFLGPEPLGQCVNHKDANKQNNRADNLEYMTRGENCAHAAHLGLYPTGEANNKAKLTIDDVCTIRVSKDTGIALAARFGVHKDTIYRVRRGEQWRHLKNPDQ